MPKRKQPGGFQTFALAVGGAAWMAALALPVLAQQATTLNGPPVQVRPTAMEPGVPLIVINPGTPNPFPGTPSQGAGGGAEDGGGGGAITGAGASSVLSTMLATSWGASAVGNAQAMGVNPSALAATCVVESGCRNVAGTGTITGAFQMSAATYTSMINAAMAQNPSLSSQITPGIAGQNDPATQAIAAAQYLKEGAQYLQQQGISNPTVLDVRGYYNFGPQGGAQIAQASPDQTMASTLTGYSAATLARNGITPGMTVGEWQAGVSRRIGNAATQSVLNS